MKPHLDLKEPISVCTAQQWMKRNKYQWNLQPKGMYSDCHERADVVEYRQNVFLPRWIEYSKHTWKWTKVTSQSNNTPVNVTAEHKRTKRQMEESQFKEWEEDCVFVAGPNGQIIVIWCHNKSIFYRHDRCQICWVKASETAIPLPKGVGKSCMAIGFVSPDHGWAALMSICPGASWDGYYRNKEILKHAMVMMDYLDANHPNEKHVFAYDNATNHTALAADALSAQKIPVNMLGVNKKTGTQKNWFVKAKEDGKDVTVQMQVAKFADGTTQSLYFPMGHPKAGVFKGMQVIIQECIAKGANLPDPTNLKAKCPGFRCPPGSMDCCARRVLFNEPDFCNQKSKLKEHCAARGFDVLFFPKFHPKCNFIKQCWGYTKQIYRMFPMSSSKDDLERNMNAALNLVPLNSMQKFATRSDRFIDAYQKVLDRNQAVWASKCYCGHR
ncbi:unnamed protein product [Mycena citricolor]|uniref:Uncharacterized protein n=1 Tax=Mycena citricolor TaxID=2018698 RepID=A0AAD2K046_9AGAR|nr:unnamed protein product [Mycena citricolor]